MRNLFARVLQHLTEVFWLGGEGDPSGPISGGPAGKEPGDYDDEV